MESVLSLWGCRELWLEQENEISTLKICHPSMSGKGTLQTYQRPLLWCKQTLLTQGRRKPRLSVSKEVPCSQRTRVQLTCPSMTSMLYPLHCTVRRWVPPTACASSLDFCKLSYHQLVLKYFTPNKNDFTCKVYLFLKQLVTSSPLDSWYNHVNFLPLWRLA